MKKRIKKKEEFNFFGEYKKSWAYVKESKNFIYSAILIFFLSALLGFFFPVPEKIIEILLEMIKELLEQTEGLSTTQLISFIFWNNLGTSFYAFFLGIFLGFIPVLIALVNGYLVGFVAVMAVDADSILSLWRLLPHGIFELPAVFISLGMGIKLGGFFFSAKDKRRGVMAFLIALDLIGILLSVSYLLNSGSNLEIPKTMELFSLIFIVFLFSIMILLSSLALSYNDRSRVFSNLLHNFLNSMRVFILIVIPLLVIAAVIEGIFISFV